VGFLEMPRESENLRRKELAERELAGETLLEIVVAVVNFVFAGCVMMVALFLGELGAQMPNRIGRLQRQRE
jgi:hypothetical protein